MDENILRSIVDRLRGNPQFIAGRLPHNEHDLAITLRINRATALRIMICRAPRQACWAADVHRIADRFALRDHDLDALMTTWTPPGGGQ
jgi:hypothetical protein